MNLNTVITVAVDPQDKRDFYVIVKREKELQPKRTQGEVFHDMLAAYKKFKEEAVNGKHR